jgi:N utilization substance protein B
VTQADDAAKDSAAPARRKPQHAARSARRRSRELAVQGLYQWLLSKAEVAEIEAHLQEHEPFDNIDREHFDALLGGCIREAAELDALLARHVDRRTSLLSPVEHAVLLIGTYDLTHCLDIPYRVAINEGVELAKSFGGTDGHKYVNGVLDKAAAELRPAEVAAARAARGQSGSGGSGGPGTVRTS